MHDVKMDMRYVPFLHIWSPYLTPVEMAQGSMDAPTESPQRSPVSPSGVRAIRPEWQGWNFPSLGASAGDDEIVIEELPAIGEYEQLILPADEEWLYEVLDRILHGHHIDAFSIPRSSPSLIRLLYNRTIAFLGPARCPKGKKG